MKIVSTLTTCLTTTLFLGAHAVAQDKDKTDAAQGHVIVGITVDGKKVLVEFDGKKVRATSDGAELPAGRLDKNGNVIIVKDGDGNPIARINRWNHGSQIYRIARSNKASIGIELERLSKGLADHLALDPDAVIYVTRAIEGRAAAKAGLRDHDVIVQIDGESPASEKVLRETLAKKKPGEKMRVRVIRRGKEKDIVIRCERAKRDPRANPFYPNQGVFQSEPRLGFGSTYGDDSLRSAIKAAIEAMKKAEKVKSGDFKKALEKAREALRKAQLRIDPLTGYVRTLTDRNYSTLRNWIKPHVLEFGKRGKRDVMFVDPSRNGLLGVTNRVKSGKSTKVRGPLPGKAAVADLGKRIARLEARFDRFERLLEKLTDRRKKDN